MICYCGKCKCKNEVFFINTACNNCNKTCYRSYNYKHKPKHKLTEAEVRNIRLQVVNGIQQKSLSKIYDVSCTTISQIVNFKKYTWVK